MKEVITIKLLRGNTSAHLLIPHYFCCFCSAEAIREISLRVSGRGNRRPFKNDIERSDTRFFCCPQAKTVAADNKDLLGQGFEGFSEPASLVHRVARYEA